MSEATSKHNITLEPNIWHSGCYERKRSASVPILSFRRYKFTRKPCCRRKPRDAAIKCSFRSKFANNIPYKYKTSHSKVTLQRYKHAGA